MDLFGGGFPGSNVGDYIESSATDLLVGSNGSFITFQGLTAGPPTAEGGRYSNLMFGITGSGE